MISDLKSQTEDLTKELEETQDRILEFSESFALLAQVKNTSPALLARLHRVDEEIADLSSVVNKGILKTAVIWERK